MRYYTFQPQFHQPIRDLIKISTIRPKEKVKVGERFALRYWIDKPYRSKMGILGTAVCVEVSPINIDVVDHVEITIADELIDSDDASECFARQEGFIDLKDLLGWFHTSNGFPFNGILTRWDPATFIAQIENP